MKALLFAAGKGNRMRPLTDHTPKPLLRVADKRLIERHLERLVAIGVQDVVINIAWLAEQFPAALGDGSHWGLRLHYSREGDEPLETGGGMLHALQWLGNEPFFVANGDVYCDMDLSTLPRVPQGLAHLVMVDNPPQHPHGDFAITADGLLSDAASTLPRLTYAGIGVYRPQLLDHWRDIVGATANTTATPPRFPLLPLLQHAMRAGQVTGQHYRGIWVDVGTPQRLAELDQQLRA
ncbi:MAG: N-acetylmuramate alpha-1-phosphate uridylyltransferase MurU [Tahibacter sp.]